VLVDRGCDYESLVRLVSRRPSSLPSLRFALSNLHVRCGRGVCPVMRGGLDFASSNLAADLPGDNQIPCNGPASGNLDEGSPACAYTEGRFLYNVDAPLFPGLPFAHWRCDLFWLRPSSRSSTEPHPRASEVQLSQANSEMQKGSVTCGDTEISFVDPSELKQHPKFQSERFSSRLTTRHIGQTLLATAALPSTQTLLHQNFTRFPDGAICVADVQTSGKGTSCATPMGGAYLRIHGGWGVIHDGGAI